MRASPCSTFLREQRHQHQILIAEAVGHRRQRHLVEHRPVAPDVRKPFAQLMKHARAHPGDHARRNLHLRQAPDNREKAHAVQKKTGADSEPRDQQSRGGGTEHARAVEHHRVERDRVGEIVVTHHLDHERLAAGHVKRSDGAVECGEQDHVLDAHGAGPGQRRERERAQHQQDLRRDYQPAAIDAVDHNAGEQTDQQDWQ